MISPSTSVSARLDYLSKWHGLRGTYSEADAPDLKLARAWIDHQAALKGRPTLQRLNGR
jgi:hypothetical protein